MSEPPQNDAIEASESPEGLDSVARAPVVFISYSHDTPAHKKWVGDLASKLMAAGIDVILDQWDLVLGDDVPKFMERGLSRADCVLMICTEAYVRKADDGKGGVGYEAMIVTGELVKDLGTAKFVPVLRQENGTKLLPKSMSTRFYADLSAAENFDQQFEELLRKIHKVPKFRKPALGKNPFQEVPSMPEPPSAAVPLLHAAAVSDRDAKDFYQLSSTAAHRNDLLSWRRLLKEARSTAWTRLRLWREKFDAAPPQSMGEFAPMTSEAFGAVSPLIAVALAGVETAEDRFKNQTGIVDELLGPPQWNAAGVPAVADVPDTLVFLYQSLHGAICMETGQVALAASLVRSRFRRVNARTNERLFESPGWIGWPSSIHENCTVAWEFLCSLPESHPWLIELFGTKEDYVVSLSAYYALLNVVELTTVIERGQTQMLKTHDLHLEVPLCGFSVSRELMPRAYRLLTREMKELKGVWESMGISTETMATHWPEWMETSGHWLSQVYRRRMFGPELYHRNLFQEIGLEKPGSDLGAMVG